MDLLKRLKDIQENDKNKKKISAQKKVSLDLGGKELHNSYGAYYLIEEEYSIDYLAFPKISLDNIKRNLCLLKGIGPVTEGIIQEKGLQYISDLLKDPRWKNEAHEVLKCIESNMIDKLRKRGAADYELLALFREDDLVFIDIETTGLWATQPLFLVGILYKENDKLKLQQYLARNLNEEKPLMEAVYPRLKDYKVVVSYNGKKFDIPYLESRWTECGMYYKLNCYHLDLLYHARRHFKHYFHDCKLVTLEENLLGHKRNDDIPGYLIPRAYYDFIKSGDTSIIKKILKHNALDLLSLARMLYIIEPTLPGVIKKNPAAARL